MQNTTMEHSSVSNLGGVMDLFSACHLMMFPFVPSVTKNISDGFSVMEQT